MIMVSVELLGSSAPGMATGLGVHKVQATAVPNVLPPASRNSASGFCSLAKDGAVSRVLKGLTGSSSGTYFYLGNAY